MVHVRLLKIFYQPLQRAGEKLYAIDKLETANSERYVLLKIIWDHVYLRVLATHGLHDEMGIVAPQIVEEDGQFILFGIDTVRQVTRIIRSSPKFSCEMAVVANSCVVAIGRERLFADVTVGGSVILSTCRIIEYHVHFILDDGHDLIIQVALEGIE